MHRNTEGKRKTTDFGEGRKGAATPLGIYPTTHLDRLLNDLQGNSFLMFEDEGLSRLERSRLRRIRADALAQAAAALIAATALRRVVREWAGASREGGPAGRVLREHLVQLRREARRWRQLAEYAARYLTYPRLARLLARRWLAETRASGESAEGRGPKARNGVMTAKKRRRGCRRARVEPVVR